MWELRRGLPTILLLTFVFFSTFMARIIMSPLLPVIEGDLKINHAQAGMIFFFLSGGILVSSIASGFISYLFNIRHLVYTSVFGVGVSIASVYLARGIGEIYLLAFFIGLFAGLYLSAGITIITSLVENKSWGKAISIHELAPNLSFITAPFFAELMVRQFHWKVAMLVLAAISLTSGVLFVLFGKGGDFKGKGAPLSFTLELIRMPRFWFLATAFGLGVGSAMGVFSMLPLFLVKERGMEYNSANYLVGISRTTPLISAFLSGILVDRIGVKKTMMAVFLLCSLSTLFLAMLTGIPLIIAVLVQPFFAQAFFPAGFAALSNIAGPEKRPMVVGLTIPFGVLIGSGLFPVLIGLMGDRFAMGIGLIIVGVFLAFGSLIAKRL